MSVVRACIRLAAVAALRDRGWADVAVADSDNRPLEAGVKETPAPYIVVFTDDDNVSDIDGRDVQGGTRALALIVEFGLSAPLPPIETQDRKPQRVATPPTDAAYELSLDAMDMLIVNALVHDPRSAWGEHFRALTMNVTALDGRRGGQVEKGVRWAARQRIFTIQPIADPVPGDPLAATHPVSKFLAALDSSPAALDVGGARAFIDDMLSPASDWSWRRAQAHLGITESEARGIGVAPAVIPDDIEAPGLKDTELPQSPE
jgi:hypothetical protein